MKPIGLTFHRLSATWVMVLSSLLVWNCSTEPNLIDIDGLDSVSATRPVSKRKALMKVAVIVPRDITINHYFQFIDSLVSVYRTDDIPSLNEYILIHTNPWIIDTLRKTDYYIQKEKKYFLYDQSQAIVLHQGDSIIIPDRATIKKIDHEIKSIIIDVNIPEFKLRIFQNADAIFTCRVRVGRNDTAYLPLVGHVVDMKTPSGQGEIIRVEKRPTYVNPDTGEKFEMTKRDDGRVTKMPIIPWIEPTINGIRYGTMIHPTTNPRSLGRAVSHGCIGTTEADAWSIFYYAPIGTKVVFRYDLRIINAEGVAVQLRDIYQLRSSKSE
jgi:Uncharacterized protein conserved in bacteria